MTFFSYIVTLYRSFDSFRQTIVIDVNVWLKAVGVAFITTNRPKKLSRSSVKNQEHAPTCRGFWPRGNQIPK